MQKDSRFLACLKQRLWCPALSSSFAIPFTIIMPTVQPCRISTGEKGQQWFIFGFQIVHGMESIESVSLSRYMPYSHLVKVRPHSVTTGAWNRETESQLCQFLYIPTNAWVNIWPDNDIIVIEQFVLNMWYWKSTPRQGSNQMKRPKGETEVLISY